MKILIVLASAASALLLASCQTSQVKEVTKLVTTLQDDKACDRTRTIDIGGGHGQLGGEGHVTFHEESQCGNGHGIKAPQKGLDTTTVIK